MTRANDHDELVVMIRLATLRATSGREIRRAVTAFGLAVFGLLVGYAAAAPSAHHLRLLLYVLIACGVVLSLPAYLFLAAVLVVVGVSTAFASPLVSAGPALYLSDAVVFMVFLRGVAPRARLPIPRTLRGLPAVLFLVWLTIMTIAGVRGMFAGIPAKSVVRADLGLFYWPLLYFGFARTLAETDLDRRLVLRYLG